MELGTKNHYKERLPILLAYIGTLFTTHLDPQQPTPPCDHKRDNVAKTCHQHLDAQYLTCYYINYLYI